MAVTSQQDLTNILGHPSNLSTSSQSSLSSLIMKNHPPLSLLGETLPYLKSSQSFTEDLNILGVSPMEDHHSEYDSKMKLSSVFDDDCDTGLMPFGQSDMKMLDSGNQCMKVWSFKDRLRTAFIENILYAVHFYDKFFTVFQRQVLPATSEDIFRFERGEDFGTEESQSRVYTPTLSRYKIPQSLRAIPQECFDAERLRIQCRRSHIRRM